MIILLFLLDALFPTNFAIVGGYGTVTNVNVWWTHSIPTEEKVNVIIITVAFSA